MQGKRIAYEDLQRVYPDDTDELCYNLGVDDPTELYFGKFKTPYGMRYFAGASPNRLEYFYDSDDGWNRAPVTHSVNEGQSLSIDLLRKIIKEEIIKARQR